jgi:hypothetical protein
MDPKLGEGDLTFATCSAHFPRFVSRRRGTFHEPRKVMGTRKPMIPMPLFNLKVAKYNGNGSTSIAANFTCITSKNHLNQTPVPKFGP